VVVGSVSRGKDDLQVVSDLVSRLVQNLQERNEQLDAIFALSPDGFVSFDEARVVRYASPGFCRITGLSADMVVGVDEDVLLFRLLSRANRQSRLTSMAMLRGGGAPGEAQGPTQIELQRPQHRVMSLALHQSRSGVVSQVLHLRDVTHESVVDRMKTEFLTTAAHELRTPMVSIFGFVELLLVKDPPEARRKHMLDVVHRQCKVMIELVNELLDLSRIEAQRDIDFAYRTVDLGALVAEVVEGFHLPDGRQAPVIVWPAHALHSRLDQGKMQQAVRNVISNAYKYSPQGGAVRVHFVDETLTSPAGTPRLGVVVQDQGIGMTPEQLQRVGERFYRADASGNIPGTGLGMRLVREVITLMGGSLELQSTPGQGTTVTLWVPTVVEPEVATAA
jgi:PAS domain S-box-containing protein